MKPPRFSHYAAFALLPTLLLSLGNGVPLRASASLQGKSDAKLSPQERAALEAITADSLRGRLSFIASDALEGRDTPSPGLDIAAEYIASEFRRAGLEPLNPDAGKEGYFQNAHYLTTARDPAQTALVIGSPGKESVKVGGKELLVQTLPAGALDAAAARAIKVPLGDTAVLNALTAAQVAGNMVCTEYPQGKTREERMQGFQAYRQFLEKIAPLKPAMVLFLDRGKSVSRTPRTPLRSAEDSASRGAQGTRNPSQETGISQVIAYTDELGRWYDGLKPGDILEIPVRLQVPAPVDRPVRLRNVAGILRGSDPAVKDSYILVTAHYDHLGVAAGDGENGDRIYNGANDDGSGTVSVVEIAAALAKINPRPKRSIVFMTFFGEEKGLLGSRYYGRHPLVPLEKTIAQINLEQIGRTDDSEGPRVSAATVTGFDYSDVGATLAQAGTLTGIKVEKHPVFSDTYFGRSDNQALADLGIPAHTVSVAYSFPGYHGLDDEWDKVDYPNMAKVARMAAAGVLLLADTSTAPRWNADNPKAARYREAWQTRHPQEKGE